MRVTPAELGVYQCLIMSVLNENIFLFNNLIIWAILLVAVFSYGILIGFSILEKNCFEADMKIIELS